MVGEDEVLAFGLLVLVVEVEMAFEALGVVAGTGPPDLLGRVVLGWAIGVGAAAVLQGAVAGDEEQVC